MSITLRRRDFLHTAAAATLATGSGTEIVLAQAGTNPRSAPNRTPSGERSLKITNLNDLEQKASRVIPAGAFTYISAGSDDQWTLRANRLAFDHHQLRPHYLVGKDAPDLRTTVLG